MKAQGRGKVLNVASATVHSGVFVHESRLHQTWFAAAYCSSVTGSSHVVPSPSSTPSSIARWHIMQSTPAPCQCSSPGGVHTGSRGARRVTVPSRATTRAALWVQKSIWRRTGEWKLGSCVGGEPRDAGDQTRRLGSLLDRVDIDVAGERAVGRLRGGAGRDQFHLQLRGRRVLAQCTAFRGQDVSPMLWWVGLGASGCRVRRRGFGRSPRGQQAKRVGGGGRVARASRARVIAARGGRPCAEPSNPLPRFGLYCSVAGIGP